MDGFLGAQVRFGDSACSYVHERGISRSTPIPTTTTPTTWSRRVLVRRECKITRGPGHSGKIIPTNN